MRSNVEVIFIPATASIREAIAAINHGGCGITLVVDKERHLVGTVTDGDVRRAILAATDLETPVSALLACKIGTQYPRPVTAHVQAGREELLALMRQYALRQIPILNDDGCVVDLVLLDDLLPTDELPFQAVIMAGGLGTRLWPLTEAIPKPMLPVGGRPLIEHIVEQLRQSGIRRVNITTNYLADKIINHFGDGHEFGVEVNYVDESLPLGTAGALGLMETPQQPLLVINGDILTKVNFRAMLAYHHEYQAILTVGVRKYELNVPYGVVESKDVYVSGLVEKPTVSFFVNAGIYLLEPAAHCHIPNGQHFNMPDLIQRLLDEGQPVVSFPIHEYWLDIGQHDDYTQAQKDVKNGKWAKKEQ